VKIEQAGKGLAGAVLICELWRLAVQLYFNIQQSSCYWYKVSAIYSRAWDKDLKLTAIITGVRV
jgi:hypothetical protein